MYEIALILDRKVVDIGRIKRGRPAFTESDGINDELPEIVCIRLR